MLAAFRYGLRAITHFLLDPASIMQEAAWRFDDAEGIQKLCARIRLPSRPIRQSDTQRDADLVALAGCEL